MLIDMGAVVTACEHVGRPTNAVGSYQLTPGLTQRGRESVAATLELTVTTYQAIGRSPRSIRTRRALTPPINIHLTGGGDRQGGFHTMS